jgi:hypothetical protein
VSTFGGATTAATVPWLLVPIVLVWGYVTGLMVCLGPRLSVAALMGMILLIGIVKRFPPPSCLHTRHV